MGDQYTLKLKPQQMLLYVDFMLLIIKLIIFQLLNLTETEHSFEHLVPGPVQYHTVGYPFGLAAVAPLKVEVPEVKALELPATYGLPLGLGYPYGLHGYPYGLHGLPVLAAPAAAKEAAVVEE